MSDKKCVSKSTYEIPDSSNVYPMIEIKSQYNFVTPVTTPHNNFVSPDSKPHSNFVPQDTKPPSATPCTDRVTAQSQLIDSPDQGYWSSSPGYFSPYCQYSCPRSQYSSPAHVRYIFKYNRKYKELY